MYSKADIDFCQLLAGRGELIARITCYGVSRRESLLLCLPYGVQSALRTLKLYQPQTWIAKWFVCCVKVLVFLRLHRFFPKINLDIRSDGPLARLITDTEEIGFLLGNPESDARCALVLRYDEGDLVVDKIGVCEAGCSSVNFEVNMIHSLPPSLKGLPYVRGSNKGANWVFYTTDYIDGGAVKTIQDKLVLELLLGWQEEAQIKPMHECELWQTAKRNALRSSMGEILDHLSGLDDLPVKQGILHGDFAPWNLKWSDERGIVVLDWEHACLSGPSGWDWLHYMIQRGKLVENLDYGELLDKCRSWAVGAEGATFLEDAGWNQKVEWWIGSYLLYSQSVAGFERRDLIEAWLLSHEKKS